MHEFHQKMRYWICFLLAYLSVFAHGVQGARHVQLLQPRTSPKSSRLQSPASSVELSTSSSTLQGQQSGSIVLLPNDKQASAGSAELMSSKAPKQVDERSRVREHPARKINKQKESRNARARERWVQRTDEQKELRSIKDKERRAHKTEEQRESENAKARERWGKMTDEQRASRNARARERRAQRTDEQKESMNAKRREHRASMTEEKKEYTRAQNKQRYARRTKLQKEQLNASPPLLLETAEDSDIFRDNTGSLSIKDTSQSTVNNPKELPQPSKSLEPLWESSSSDGHAS